MGMSMSLIRLGKQWAVLWADHEVGVRTEVGEGQGLEE